MQQLKPLLQFNEVAEKRIYAYLLDRKAKLYFSVNVHYDFGYDGYGTTLGGVQSFLRNEDFKNKFLSNNDNEDFYKTLKLFLIQERKELFETMLLNIQKNKKRSLIKKNAELLIGSFEKEFVEPVDIEAIRILNKILSAL